LDRYARHEILPWFGSGGRKKLGRSSVLVVGCGGTGCVCSSFLVRAGLGRIVLLDRDVVSLTDLHRQVLYDEADLEHLAIKVDRARAVLSRANRETEIEAVPEEFSPANAGALTERADLVVDCSDNFETRMLINDACLKYSTPWVHGACAGTSGIVIPFPEAAGVCYRCVVDHIPAGAASGSASGILGPVAGMTGALEAAEAIKMLVAPREARTIIIYFDALSYTYESIKVRGRQDCPACVGGRYDFLEAAPAGRTFVDSESGTIRIHLSGPIDTKSLRERLAATTAVEDLGLALRIVKGEAEVVIFADGGAVIRGAGNPQEARRLLDALLEG
jgi:molybdopterin/thiamine biosynthesis adenylyltransferase